MIDYQTFASVLSVLLIVLYGTLVLIAFRRSEVLTPRVRARVHVESVRDHARRVEGPLFTFALFVALVLSLSALSLSEEDANTLKVVVGGALRGSMTVIGVYILGYYWKVRETWL